MNLYRKKPEKCEAVQAENQHVRGAGRRCVPALCRVIEEPESSEGRIDEPRTRRVGEDGHVTPSLARNDIQNALYRKMHSSPDTHTPMQEGKMV